jgi:hypothetical protein
MTNGKHSCPKTIVEVLKTAPDAREFLAGELRDMAAGRREYREMMQTCAAMPPWIRHIWLAAAEMIVVTEDER